MAETKVTPAETQSNVKFSAYRNTTYTTVNGANTKMPYDTKNFDTGSNYDAVTNFRFTAPVAGFYQINAMYTMGGAVPTVGVLFLYKNGVQFCKLDDVRASVITLSGSWFGQLAANDYMEVYYYVNVAATLDITSTQNNRFECYLTSTT